MLGISFALFAVERCSLSSEALSNATGSLKLFLLSFSSGINSSILSAPSTIILFYYSTNIVFLLESRSFLPSLPSCDILEQSVSVSFQDFIIHYYKFSKLCVEFGWMFEFLIEISLSFFFFISPIVHVSVFSAQKSCRESLDVSSACAPCCCYGKLGSGH